MKIEAGQVFGKWTVLEKVQGKKGYWLCECECTLQKQLQASHLRHGKGQGCINCWKIKNQTSDIVNQKFGKWTVIQKDKVKTGVHDYWICECECGKKTSIYGSHLRLNRTASCRKCSENKHKHKLNSRLWNRMLRGADIREINVDLGEPEEAKKFLYDLLYKEQNCICALSGLPIIMATTNNGDMRGETTASIDRIDSTKGYTRDNVQWVHKLINRMKLQLNQDEFISFCEAVVKHKRGI